MINFNVVRWKNFLSTGNSWIEVELNKNSTNLIIGANGAGKSTILDALCFSLYGKSFRKINKPQLVNSVNEKDCKVEVEFSIGNVNWKIVRGIKPNIFEIYKDGSMIDQSSAALDHQKWLEQNVLKMNYKSFTQIVILGSSTFVPFMQLSTSNRREVIEDLLDIKIFSSMNSVIKEKIRQTREQLNILDIKKQSLSDKLEMQKKFISEIENRSKENIKSKLNSVQSLQDEINEYIDENVKINSNIEELENKIKEYNSASDKIKKLEILRGKISQKMESIKNESKFFNDNSVCPTCTQTIDEQFRINRIEDAQNKIDKLNSGFLDLENTLKTEEERERQFLDLSSKLLKLTNAISQNNIKISGCQRQIRDIECEIQTITKQLENRNIEHAKLEELEEKLRTTYEELITKKELISYYDYCYSLLKDGGVKAKIIKKYLPLINQQVNRYLQMMDFYINFVLDEEFNETIQSPIHEDFSYSSFSEGEKSRINLSLIFAWREVAKFKNSTNCNIILFDEVFDGSLDGSGTEEFLKIIRYVLKDTNVFVISHKTGLEDKFENVYKAEKIKGFSRLNKL